MTIEASVTPTIRVWCDGACEPINPGGIGSWGYVIVFPDGAMASAYGLVGRGLEMSNNVAEYEAVIRALDALSGWSGAVDVVLYGDSKLWVNQLGGSWNVERGLYVSRYERARELLTAMQQRGMKVRCVWIPREKNTEADALSKKALEEANVPIRTHQG